MPPPRSHHIARRRSSAFALFAVLVLVGLCAACAFSLAALSKTHLRENHNRAFAQSARSAARAGTLIALADLQTYTGADDCATSKFYRPLCGKSTEEWLGAWHGRRISAEFSEYAPLVSNRGNFAGTQSCSLRDFSMRDTAVDVPWEPLGENARIAFFIVDESALASFKKRERDDHLARFETAPETLVRLRQQLARRTNFSPFFEDADADSAFFREKIDAAQDAPGFLSSLREKFSDDALLEARKSLVAESLGVPANWQKCELKADLSADDSTDELAPSEALAFLRQTEATFPPTGTAVATCPPQTAGTAGFFTHPFPLLAELKLHLGFFNPRSDGQHRIRFHVTARFWNPYSFPLLAHGDGRLGLFDVKNLPTILIRNENTGGEISVSPSDFPTGQFGLVKQTPSDRTCNAYCRIFDASAQGIGADGNAAGLLPGEVFLARFPDPSGQPEGLARNTGGSSWKYQKTLAYIAKPPSGAKADAWFHPLHEIRIESLPSLLPVSFMIRGDSGSLPQATFPQDYSEPVWECRNLFLPLFSMVLSGEDYNRQKAGEYDISQASLVWKIRLRAENEEAMAALFRTVDLRSGVLDFNVPAVANAFEVSSLTGADAAKEAEIGGENESFSQSLSPLRDPFPNEHNSAGNDAFSCIRIFDTPREPVLSVGALRHCAFEAFPPHAGIGDPATVATSTASAGTLSSPNALFDRAYFSAKNFEDGSPHPHFVSLKNGKSETSCPLVSGAFNINSENALAWAAKLPHDVPDWRQYSSSSSSATTPSGGKKDLKNAFFMHPFSAQIPVAGTQKAVYSDAELELLSGASRASAFGEQSLRELSSASAMSLAKTLAQKIGERRSGGETPFRSIEEFADSGILEAAIEECGLNTVAGTRIPAWYPSAISQRALLEAFAPVATPRGDTFTIICRAEVFHPITQKTAGTACAKMRVQRVPEFFDVSQAADTPFAEQNALNRAFGRRYKILSFQWLPHDEF